MNIYNFYSKRLGEISASISYGELATVAYENIMTKTIHQPENVKITELNFKEVNVEKEHSRIYLNNIVLVQIVFQEFLDNIKEYIKENGINKMPNKKKEESLLEYYKKNLNLQLKDEIEICDYYRTIRNYYIHSNYKEIKYTEKLEKLNVHRHENINFEDFILFAKTTRKVAKEIYNNIQLDYEKILLKNKNKFARYKNNKNKFIAKYKELLKTEYSENDLNSIEEEKLFHKLIGP